MAALKVKVIGLLVLHLVMTFNPAAGVEIEFTMNSTTLHEQDLTCYVGGSGANSEIKGVVQIDIIAMMETSEQRLATVSGIFPTQVTPGQSELLKSFGNISGKEGVLRLKLKTDEKVLKYACRVMVLDKEFKHIRVEKLRQNKGNVLLSMLNQRFAGISSGVDLHEAFQKLEDKVEDTQDFLTDKLENTQGLLTNKLEDTENALAKTIDLKSDLIDNFSRGILRTETFMNETVETFSEILDTVRTNQDQGRHNQKEISSLSQKFDAFSGVLDSLVAEISSVKNTLEKENQTRTEVTSRGGVKHSQVPISSRVTIPNAGGISLMFDMETDGGGWIVFQRRINGRVDFYRNWTEYENGFGDIDSSFWMGLKPLSAMVAKGRWELRVEFEYKGKMYYAEYSSFSIGDSSTNYALAVSGHSGTAGDDLANRHSGKAFSTFDADHDTYSGNCAEERTGAWWYDDCLSSNLNGRWGSKAWSKGVIWDKVTGVRDSATFSEMKIRLRR